MYANGATNSDGTITYSVNGTVVNLSPVDPIPDGAINLNRNATNFVNRYIGNTGMPFTYVGSESADLDFHHSVHRFLRSIMA